LRQCEAANAEKITHPACLLLLAKKYPSMVSTQNFKRKILALSEQYPALKEIYEHLRDI
jgi:hypothetical protein